MKITSYVLLSDGQCTQISSLLQFVQYLALATHSSVASLLPATTLVLWGGTTMTGAAGPDGSVAPARAEKPS